MSDIVELKNGELVYVAYPGTSGVYHAASVLGMANKSAKRRGDHIELLSQEGNRLAFAAQSFLGGTGTKRALEQRLREWNAVQGMNTMEASKTMLALVGLDDDG